MVRQHILLVFFKGVVAFFIVGVFAVYANETDCDNIESNCKQIWPLVSVATISKVETNANDDFVPTEAEKNTIGNLIDDLARIDKADIGLGYMPIGGSFIPIGQLSPYGERTRTKVDSFPAIRKLVEFGPKAIPQLLKSLDDNLRTELVIQAESLHLAAPGWSEMWFDDALPGNPANALEQRVLHLGRYVWPKHRTPQEEIEAYRVKVGDVCLAVIGQIVGRDYAAAYIYHPVSGGMVICSPVCSKRVCSRIRSVWESTNPKQRLLDSLLLDYSTRGIFNGGSLDDWYIGNNFQTAAVIRLLYYFPKETSEIIAGRLDGLDVSTAKDFIEQYVKNGVRADHFIDAVGWSRDPIIQKALYRLSERATDTDVLRALDRAGYRSKKGSSD